MRRALGVTFACLLAGSIAQSQNPDVARLRAAVAADPAAPSPRCELAWALVLTNAHHEAVEVVTPAITTLRARTDAAAKRSLGACLYNRGRAYEALGDRAHAIVDYADSLENRPNQTVAQRLATLVPNVPAAAPRVAIAVAAEPTLELASPTRVVASRTAGGTAISLFAGAESTNPSAYAVARLCGELRVKKIDEGYFDNVGILHIESAQPRTFGDLDAIHVRLGGSGNVTCMRMDGVMDGVHEATAVVFVQGCELRAWHHVTEQNECDGRQRRTRVVFREGTTVAIESGSGRRVQTFATYDLRTAAE